MFYPIYIGHEDSFGFLMSSVAQLEAEISTYFLEGGGYIWPPGIPVLIEIWVSNSYWRTWPQLLITLWKFCVAHSISFLFIIKNVGAVYARCMRGVCAKNFAHTWSVCRINIITNGGYQVSWWKWMRVNIESLALLATIKQENHRFEKITLFLEFIKITLTSWDMMMLRIGQFSKSRYLRDFFLKTVVFQK